jgi:hypothetical protein
VTDDVPDYPPGPRGPEDPAPGVRITLTRDKARFIGLYVASVEGASSVDIEDRGAGYFNLTVYDKSGIVIAERTVFPYENSL